MQHENLVPAKCSNLPDISVLEIVSQIRHMGIQIQQGWHRQENKRGNNIMIIKNTTVFLNGSGFVNADVRIENGAFAEFSSSLPGCGQDVLDAQGSYLIPGLVDVHFHGAAGADFSDGNMDGLHRIAGYEASRGITSICPAALTLPEEQLLKICSTAAEYASHGYARGEAKLCAVNLEGPFISEHKLGAQNPAFVRKPDIDFFDRLQKAAGGLVRLVTVAPEAEGAFEFIEAIKQRNALQEGHPVHISIGHTACDYDTAKKALAAGADHITHFYNAMTGFTHRSPGVVGAAMDWADEANSLFIELVCDGIHVHPAAIRLAFRVFGADRIVLVSDSMRAVGMENGSYTLGGLSVNVKGHHATLADGTLAGSATDLMDCMKTAASMGIPLETAIKCATCNPAKSIGLADKCGKIAVGRAADCVMLEKDSLDVKYVIMDGNLL